MHNKSNKPPQRKTRLLYFLILKLSKYLKLSTIVYFPVLLSALVFLIGSLIAIQVYPDGAPFSFTGIILFITFFISGLTGFIQISIEEVPSFLFPVEGKAAIWFGILWIIIFWLMAICAVWYYFL